MRKYDLGFINDAQFFNHVKEMVERLTESMDLKKFSKNIIDPIKMTVEMHAYQITLEEAVTREIARQLGKTVESAIGWFHQNIFRYIPGWQIPDDGVDVMNDQMTIFGFFVGDYVQAQKQKGMDIMRMAKGIVIGNPNAKVFLIKSQCNASVTDNSMAMADCASSKKLVCDQIKQISLPQFYEIISGRRDAYARVAECLDEALREIGLGDILKSQLEECIVATIR